jgi:dehydrogenase/reductase SDR family protein 1
LFETNPQNSDQLRISTNWSTKMHLLKDKVAVVIGASRGIGRGIAIGLGREGAQLVLAALTMEPGEKSKLGSEGYTINGSLKETAREIEITGGKADIIQCDALDYDQIQAMVEETIRKYSRIDILVISLQPDCQVEGSLYEMPVSAWDDHMSVVPRAYYYAGRAVAPHMEKQGFGLITAVSSPGGTFDFYSIPYCVARSAIDRLAQAFDHELGEAGVAAVSLWPTTMRTERVGSAHAGESQGFSIDNSVDLEIAGDAPELLGKAIANLSVDPELAKLSGRVQVLNYLAKRYNLKDENGSAAAPVPHLDKLIADTGSLAPSAYTVID